jgi:hypothetical protein
MNPEDLEKLVEHEPVHNWFGLTYANYLVVPRVLLQSAPEEWQRKFVRLMHDLEMLFPDHQGHEYWVRRKERGQDGRLRFVHDPLAFYRHQRIMPRQITHQPAEGRKPYDMEEDSFE